MAGICLYLTANFQRVVNELNRDIYAIKLAFYIVFCVTRDFVVRQFHTRPYSTLTKAKCSELNYKIYTQTRILVPSVPTMR